MVLFMNSSVFVEDVKDLGEDFNNKAMPPTPQALSDTRKWFWGAELALIAVRWPPGSGFRSALKTLKTVVKVYPVLYLLAASNITNSGLTHLQLVRSSNYWWINAGKYLKENDSSEFKLVEKTRRLFCDLMSNQVNDIVLILFSNLTVL